MSLFFAAHSIPITIDIKTSVTWEIEESISLTIEFFNNLGH